MTMLSRVTGLGRTASVDRGARPSGRGIQDESVFHARLGTDLYRRGLYARAAQEFRWSLAIDPGSADVHNHLAITLNAQGKYEEAVVELRQALAINPAHAEAARNLARTLRVAALDEAPILAPTPRQAQLPN